MSELNDGYLPNTEEVASEVLDGEAVLINLSNGMYYSIDGVGGRVWELIEQGRSLASITRDIVGRYEVAEEKAASDLRKFVEELIAEELVMPAETVGEEADPPPGSRGTYAAPELNVFRDMGDLLALDPPMPGLQDIPWKESTEDPPS